MSVKQLFDLSGKVALITGGSRGLGLQMADALGEMGARLAITARKPDELAVARSRLEAQGSEVLSIAEDLAQFERIPALVDQVLAHYGRIDILVNNAGATWAAPAADYPVEAWLRVIDLNVNATFLLTREVGRRALIPQRSGKVVVIASIAGLRGNPPNLATLAYNTSKGAEISFVRALAAEWGKYNINVNAICPGFFPTRMSNGLLASLGEQIVADTALGRVGGDDDLKGAIVFLASEASRHVTGHALTVDGGSMSF